MRHTDASFAVRRDANTPLPLTRRLGEGSLGVYEHVCVLLRPRPALEWDSNGSLLAPLGLEHVADIPAHPGHRPSCPLAPPGTPWAQGRKERRKEGKRKEGRKAGRQAGCLCPSVPSRHPRWMGCVHREVRMGLEGANRRWCPGSQDTRGPIWVPWEHHVMEPAYP